MDPFELVAVGAKLNVCVFSMLVDELAVIVSLTILILVQAPDLSVY